MADDLVKLLRVLAAAPLYADHRSIHSTAADRLTEQAAEIERLREPYQQRVSEWLVKCFGETIASDRTERNHRFIEEALELAQSGGATASECHQLVDYVFGRPTGEMWQEVGGVMNTLAAFCRAYGLDMIDCGDRELARCWEKIDRIREKQRNKPKHSPLPEEASSADRAEALAKRLVETLNECRERNPEIWEGFVSTKLEDALNAAQDAGYINSKETQAVIDTLNEIDPNPDVSAMGTFERAKQNIPPIHPGYGPLALWEDILTFFGIGEVAKRNRALKARQKKTS